MGRSPRHKQDGKESACLTCQNIDEADLSRSHALPIDGREDRAEFQFYDACGIRFIGEVDSSANGVRLWNPVFSGYVYVG